MSEKHHFLHLLLLNATNNLSSLLITVALGICIPYGVGNGINLLQFTPDYSSHSCGLICLINEINVLKTSILQSKASGTGTTWANVMNSWMNHAPDAGLITWPFDLQSNTVPICYGCTLSNTAYKSHNKYIYFMHSASGIYFISVPKKLIKASMEIFQMKIDTFLYIMTGLRWIRKIIWEWVFLY